MATALGASITRSTSPCTTSLSLMATMPCEFKLRTWLPAMPAYTEWISHPAISSASSTARWIDCTVDSIFTPTPFFRPREGWLPRPITSIEPSAVISPTSATTFEVPISSPTITFLSAFLTIAARLVVRRRPERRCTVAAALPADREAVAVAHIHVSDVGRALTHQLRGREHEALEALIDRLPAQAHHHAVVERQVPGATGVEFERGEPQADFGQVTLRDQITCGDFLFRAGGPGELRQFGRHEARIAQKQFAACIEHAGVVPARHRCLLDDFDLQAARPAALHGGAIDPGQGAQPVTDVLEIDRHQPIAAQARAHDLFHVQCRDALQPAADDDSRNRLVEQQRQARERERDHRDA